MAVANICFSPIGVVVIKEVMAIMAIMAVRAVMAVSDYQGFI